MTDPTIYPTISRPGRYLGQEYNSVQKEWDSAQARFCLIFPDLYEIGMSHQGLQILYHILNKKSQILAERCYCPDIDVENVLRQKGQPLISLESRRPLTDFDVLGITLPYELCYTNILTVFNLCRIPFYSHDRDRSFPLILGGGACSLNPEPVADFFDAIVLGDGEEAIVDIAEFFTRENVKGLNRQEQLALLADIDGVYVPSHFQPEYDDRGHIEKIRTIAGNKEVITRRVIKNLDDIEHLKNPIVPNAKIVHDRLGIEVARGCTRGCRFCQAGITYRPVRERSVEAIMELAETGLQNSGFEELALLSLSTGDYSCLGEVLPALMDRYADDNISVAMPSMRVGTLTPTAMEQIKRVRKTGFTLAPEAGSERLRRVINKGITEADLLDACTTAFGHGWQIIKLYFMIGLPTETDTDIDEMVDLVKKVLATRNTAPAKGKRQINISVGTFVPKPHTPFQWHSQLTIAESQQYLRKLGRDLPGKGCNFRYHSPHLSYLEGVFSRGDRRLARLIDKAWQQGARLDGWTEHFDLARWQNAASDCHLDLDFYLRERSLDETLPWQHLRTGVDSQFLIDELDRATSEIYTPDCRYHSCQQCGLCDFETLFPVVRNRSQEPREATDAPEYSKRQQVTAKTGDSGHFKYIVHYSRRGEICYLGHLEFLRFIFRVLRRANIHTNFSQGFNPSPKISFGPALAAGTESMAEYFIMDLPALLKDPAATVMAMNEKMVGGIQVESIALHSGRLPQKVSTTYEFTLPREISSQEKSSSVAFLEFSEVLVTKTRKGKSREIDIRPLVADVALQGTRTAVITLLSASAEPGIKPIEALTTILQLDDDTALQTRILKTSWKSLD